MLAAVTAAVWLAAILAAAMTPSRHHTRRHTRPISTTEIRAYHRSRRHHPAGRGRTRAR